jgi:hypothetical protein
MEPWDTLIDPLQGEVVKDLDELENYAWCGHGTLTGRRRFRPGGPGRGGSKIGPANSGQEENRVLGSNH